MTVYGDLLRVRFGRTPVAPDADDLAPEFEPLPIGKILVEE